MKKLITITTICLLIFFISLGISSQKIEYGGNFNNSYFNDLRSICKTAMIIVPHEDDEINLAGAIIKNLTANHCNVIVVFVTNGDYENLGKRRIVEGINSCKTLGVEENNVIFLGYGDTWNQSKYSHIYHAPDNEHMTSYAGYKKTYGISTHPDYATKKYGYSCIYTRKNILNNIKAVIKDYIPDQIYCVDFDLHPDHRAVSLLFEEAICQILKNTEGYYPQIYKGFAYTTAWIAANDFYNLNMYSTKKPHSYHLQNRTYETDVPQYTWKDRVRFPIPKDMLTHTIPENPIFKALLKHKTQRAFNMGPNIINSDEVFWSRATNSITLKSNILASSGDTRYLNDFKLFDCKDITKKTNVEYCNYLWAPETNDTIKSITIKFYSPQNINKISLYDNLDLKSNILSGILTFSDNSKIRIGILNPNGSKTDICFPVKKNITSFSFKILSYEGPTPGLSEIEAFPPDNCNHTHLIKLLDRDTDMFIYRYFVNKDQKNIALGVYQYPNYLNYNIKILNQSKSKAFIKNNRIFFENGFKSCKIRAELKNNSNVFDEVEFVQLNKWNIFVYHCVTFLSKVETELIKGYTKIYNFIF